MNHHMPSTAKSFIGQNIQSIERIKEYEVKIYLANGEVWSLSVDGDCCSHSIFYDIVIPKECVGSEILEVLENVEGQSEEEVLRLFKDKFHDFFEFTDCLRIWDVVFKTKAGNILVRHINNSNGYYDGATSFKQLS